MGDPGPPGPKVKDIVHYFILHSRNVMNLDFGNYLTLHIFRELGEQKVNRVFQ